MSAAIVVQDLGKQCARYHADRPTTLKGVLVQGLRRLRPVERFWALRHVSFEVTRGRMVGVIGANGAGKSTLLRLISGVGRPDEGSVQVHGRIGALLELGAGFHPDLTGRENVFVSGVIAGLTRREIAQRFDAIVTFAEVQKFIESPLRTYSTGMQMRLAFAVAVHTMPEVLFIDEALAVGDLMFQRKCIERICQFKAEGCTIFLVSHDPTQIRQLCDEVLWLRAGQLVAHGDAETVVEQYVSQMENETRRHTPEAYPTRPTSTGTELRVNENRFGSMELEIVTVHLRDQAGLLIAELESGGALHIDIEYFAPHRIDAANFSVTISCEDGQVCCDTNTTVAALSLSALQGRGRITLQIERLDLNGGRYYIDVGAYERDWTYAYDYHWHVYPLYIRPSGGKKGILCPPSRWEAGETVDCKPSLSPLKVL
jgi:lipopolysaccharide transport system ATP-binding protein